MTFEKLLDRATARLAGDTELRLEVRRELLTHLRAAAADHAAAGHADAIAAAAESLGEPDVLADHLWQTHRRRIRRRQWARLLTATFAWPVGVVVLAALLVSLVRSAAPVAAFLYGPDAAAKLPWWPVALLARVTPADRLAALPPERRALVSEAYDLFPDMIAAAAAAKAVADAHPGDRAAYAAYVGWELRPLFGSAGPSDPPFPPGKLAALLALIDRGAALDPDNALYPLWTAQALARASSVQLRDQKADYFPYRERWLTGNHDAQPCWKLRVDDPAMFERAVAQFRRAVTMPRLDDYADAYTARRLAAMPDAHDLGTQAMRAAQQWATPKIAVLCVDLTFTMAARALDLAVAGHAAEAERLMADVRAAEAMSAAAVDRIGLAGFPLGCVRLTSAHAAAVLQSAGHADAAARLRTWADAQNAAYFDAYKTRMVVGRPPANAGLLEGRVAYLMHSQQPAAAALSRAEYTLADRAALAALMGLLLAAAAAMVLATGVGAIGAGGRHALLLLPGARESALLLATALGVPIAAYATYVFKTSGGSRAAGLGGREDVLIAEYLVLATAVVTVAVLVARRRVVNRLEALLPRRKPSANPTTGDVKYVVPGAALVAWRCLGRPGLLIAAGFGVAIGLDHWSKSFDAVAAGALLSACVAAAVWIVVEIVRDARLRQAASGSAGLRRNVWLAVATLGVATVIVAAWGFSTKDLAALTIIYVLVPTAIAGGIVAVAMAAMDSAGRVAAERGVRVAGTVLRSVALRLVMVAVVAGVVGGPALRWAEARAVRQAEQADGLVVNPPIESDAKIAALRDFTVSGLREQRQTFERLAASANPS